MKSMTIFSLDELKNLVQNPEYPCVSLYLPMEKLGGDTRQNPIRFKNLIREAETRLDETGLRHTETVNLLKPAMELDNTDFWEIQNDLPAESRTHVKKFIATHYIFEKDGSETTGKKTNSTALANQLTSEELLSSDTTTVYGKYAAMVICKNLEIDIAQFLRWNANFDKEVGAKPVAMRIPRDRIKPFISKRNQIIRESVMLLIQENSTYDNEFPETSTPQAVQTNKMSIKNSSKKNQKSSSSSKPASSSK